MCYNERMHRNLKMQIVLLERRTIPIIGAQGMIKRKRMNEYIENIHGHSLLNTASKLGFSRILFTLSIEQTKSNPELESPSMQYWPSEVDS